MISILLVCFFNISCSPRRNIPESREIYASPLYEDIRLIASDDTLHFKLSENVYNKIKSINYFRQNSNSYISFYDERSGNVVVYDLKNNELVNSLDLNKTFHKKSLFKVSVFAYNLDSIFVTEYNKLYLLNRDGKIKLRIPFLDGKEKFASMQTNLPFVKSNGIVYTGVRPFVDETSLSEIANWKILYSFDLSKKKADLNYSLPELYTKSLYGRRFLDYSYCYNEKGNFVFSFPADTNIYETNLKDIHFSHNAKSRIQTEPIDPVKKKDLLNDEGKREYTLRVYYGPLYFDNYHRRYLRFFKAKVPYDEYSGINYDRHVNVIVLDQNLRIISEFDFNKDYFYDALIFTPGGDIYARVNNKDEQFLHFVKLVWSDQGKKLTSL